MVAVRHLAQGQLALQLPVNAEWQQKVAQQHSGTGFFAGHRVPPGLRMNHDAFDAFRPTHQPSRSTFSGT